MSRATWAAIFAAIIFPSIALVIVLLDRQASSKRSPEAHSPPPAGRPHHPPPHQGRGPLEDDALVKLRKQLALTDEQVNQIWKVGESARRRRTGLHDGIRRKKADIQRLLSKALIEDDKVVRCLEELHGLRLEMDKLRVLTPLSLRRILNLEQSKKLVEIWNATRRRGPSGRPHHPPPHDRQDHLLVPLAPESSDQ